jgi:hypothetical protein
MSRLRSACALLAATLEAGLLASFAFGQMQPSESRQGVILPTGGATRSQSSSSPGAPSAGVSPRSTGASSWVAGQGSFGPRAAMPGATPGARGLATGGPAPSNASTWGAGRGDFGSTASGGGMWLETPAVSHAVGNAQDGMPATSTFLPAASPNFTTPAFVMHPFGTPPGRFAASRFSASRSTAFRFSAASSGSKTRRETTPGTSIFLRGNAFARMDTKSRSTGAGRRTGSWSRRRGVPGAGTRVSRFGTKASSPSPYALPGKSSETEH